MKTLRYIVTNFIFNIFIVFIIFGQNPQNETVLPDINLYSVKQWTGEQGIPTNAANCIMQSSDGYLWFGTFSGFVRFDGISLKNFKKSDFKKMTNAGIFKMTEDNSGTFYFGTNDGVFILYKDGTEKLLTKNDGLPANTAFDVFYDSKQRIWIGTNAGVVYYQNDKITPIKNLPIKNKNNTRVSIIEDKNQNIWILTTSDGVIKLKNDSVAETFPEIDTKVLISTSIFCDKKGNIWISTSKGLYLKEENKPFRLITQKDGLPEEFVNIVYEDKNGVLWIGTSKGLCYFYNNSFSSILKLKNTPVYDVESIFQDNENNIWVATYRSGIFRMQSGTIVCYTDQQGLAESIAYGIAKQKNGNLLIALQNNINIWDGKIFSQLQVPGLDKLKNIKDIYEDSQQNIWIGSKSGLGCIKDKKLKIYNVEDGLSNDYARLVLEDRNHAIWVGTSSGLSKFKDGKWKNFTLATGLSNDYILSLLEDNSGNIWVGTRDGLNKIHNDSIQTFSMKDNLLGNLAFQMHQDSSGALWISHNGGITKYFNNKFYPIKTPFESVFQIIEDQKGYFWFTSNDGIFSIQKNDLNEYLRDSTKNLVFRTFNNLDGMLEKSCHANTRSAVDNDGKLWFCTLNGIAVIDPYHIKKNIIPPVLKIEQIEINDSIIPLTDEIIIPTGNHRLRIVYTAFNFSAPERVKFKYQLVGLDKQFVNVGTRREVIYPDFPTGNFTFRVIACNNDDVWNMEGSSIKIKHLPYFYQTYWFYLLLVSVLIISVFSVYKYRVYAYKKQNQLLEQIVKERTSEVVQQKEEIESQRDEIEEQRDKIEQSYNNVQMLSEIGKEITFNLNIEKIVETVYLNVNNLMDATVFSLGIFQAKNNGILIFSKEQHTSVEPFIYDLSDKNRLAVICFEQQQEIFINDMDVEYIQYMPERKKPVSGNYVSSILYLPLMLKNECIGIISVQSYNKNEYTQNDLYILRNIAIYTSIALENGNAFRKIDEQKQEIEKSHKHITASINYAKRIQTAILPNSEIISMLLPDHFILFKPRDIVSGDFYYIKQMKQFTIIAVADCTGHGVPGAFMSMLGIAILNELVQKSEIQNSSQLIQELRKQVKISLQQTGQKGEQQDGMDIAFCAINLENYELSFAGAHNPCWIFRQKNQLDLENQADFIELSADRMPVGIFAKERPFTEHTFQLQPGDVMYLFSDGFHSQFGGRKNRKFKAGNFKSLLSSIYKKDMNEQKELLEQEFNQWKGSKEQTDDVLVMGIRI
jgi:ligand-binding sensor domain-containing protein/serine phosphatase RsbU (regulator of sigma subunit)